MVLIEDQFMGLNFFANNTANVELVGDLNRQGRLSSPRLALPTKNQNHSPFRYRIGFRLMQRAGVRSRGGDAVA
jgi:hypothetical protein